MKSDVFPVSCRLGKIKTTTRWMLGARNYEEIMNETLHCSSLCGLQMSPKLRAMLLSLEKEITIAALRKTLTSEGGAKIGSALIANHQRIELENAYNKFRILGQNTTAIGRPDSKNIAWIVSDKHFKSDGKITHNASNIIHAEVKKYSDLVAHEWENWLPWMSLGIVVKLQTWRNPKLNCLRRALFKLSKSIEEEISNANYPWEAYFSKNLSTLPMPSLYQFEPDNKTLDAISTLMSMGFQQVNHLRFLHPEAIQFAKDRKNPCKNFYKMLND